MECRIDLNDQEWQLVLDLLKDKRGDLRTEIHHTGNRQFRTELNSRMATIDNLIHRLQEQPVTA